MIIIVVMFVVVLFPVFFTFTSAPFRVLEECGVCHYSLKGLSEHAKCPECGNLARAFEWSTSHSARRSSVNVPVLIAACLALVAYLAFGQLVSYHLVLVAYSLDGYSESAAAIVIHKREFRPYEYPAIKTLAPLTFFVVFSPVFAAFKGRLAAELWTLFFIASLLLSVVHGTEVLRHL